MAIVEDGTEQAKSRLPAFLRPEPPGNPIVAPPEELERLARHYRTRILLWTTIGYAIFYFVRKNLSTAMPFIEKDLGITKASLGLFLTLHGVLYGLSKFTNGFLADRANGRVLMAIGLLMSALMNVCFGFSKTSIMLGIFWMANGWFQGVGFPPIARLLTHWFPPKELASRMALWNSSHTIGYATILVMTGFLVRIDWRLCFFVPAGIAVVMAILLLMNLRDTPEAVGLPEVEGTFDGTEADSLDHGAFKKLLREKVFGNPYIWLFAIGNFFVYTLRYSVADWGPTALKEYKHLDVSYGAWMTAAFELAGLPGIILSGWATDKFFRGRTQIPCLICMVMAGLALLAFWLSPTGHVVLNTGILMVAGFFIYGPQALTSIAGANLATKRAAATAVGLIGLFGYLSTVLSGWGLGLLVQKYGWGVAFECLMVAAALGAIVFLACWAAPADGYLKKVEV